MSSAACLCLLMSSQIMRPGSQTAINDNCLGNPKSDFNCSTLRIKAVGI